MSVKLNQQIHNNTNFTAKRKPMLKDIEKVSQEALQISPTELSLEAKKYVQKAHNLIEDTWVRIRKKEVDMVTPTFNRNIFGRNITLAPLYRNSERSIVLQIDGPKSYERITVDKYAKEFSYEKVVKTEFGSATTKSYNSKTSPKDKNATTLINGILEDYLPKFINQFPNV